MKVYIVLGSWCEDTWIEGVYATKEIADKAASVAPPINKRNPSTTSYWVEEWETQS